MHDRACFARHMGQYLIAHKTTHFDLRRFLDSIKAGIVQPRAEAPATPKDAKPYAMLDSGVALIGIEGVMFKGFSKYSDVNTVQVRRDIRAAAADPDVKGAMLLIDSPGGSAAGTEELANDVRAFAARKPTRAYIDDTGASAAYWVASAARSVSINGPGEAGSIGVVAVIDDESKRFEQAGVKVHVISTGPFKGAFVSGAEVTKDQIAYAQHLIDALGDRFAAAVTLGRGLTGDALKAVSDGRVFPSGEALDLGLVDRIESFDDALAGLRDEIEAAARSDRVDRMRARVAEERLDRVMRSRAG